MGECVAKAETVAYIRVSTEKQVEEGYGLDSQKRDIEEYCRKNNLLITDWYIDAGLTGKDMSERVELQRLIADTSKISNIVVYKLDRLARHTLDSLYMIEKLFTPKGIKVNSVHDFALYETPQDKFQTHIMSAVSEYDRATMLLRMRGGMLERVKNGYWMGGGNLPYCYSYDKKTGILFPIPERAEKARQAMELFISGYSDAKISEMLGFNHERTVYSILTGVVNIGMIPYKGNIYAGRHEPIFDKERFELAQELRKSRRERKVFSHKGYAPNLLTGLCYCGNCGCAMRYQKWGAGENAQKKMYCCSRNKDLYYLPNYNHDCKEHPMWARDVEEQVEEQILKISADLSKCKPKGRENKSKLDLMQSQLAKEKNKLKRLYVLYAEGNDAVLEVIEQVKSEVERLETSVKEESEASQNVQKKDFVYDTVKTLADVWKQTDTKNKNMILKTIISKILIVNGKIEIQLRNF